MRLEIPNKVNPNCHVFKLGFTFPVCIWSKRDYESAVQILSATALGHPCREYHYAGVACSRPVIKSFYKDKNIEDLRWFAGQQSWRARIYPQKEFWLVFKSEKDRTMAMMLLGD
jgi:hypothetical protein